MQTLALWDGYQSVLEVELDLLLEFLVRVVATPRLKVNQVSKRVVKGQQLFGLSFVSLNLFLENNDVFLSLWDKFEFIVTGVVANIVLRHELLNADAVLLINHICIVIKSATHSAPKLALLNLEQNFLWQAQVNECI